MITFKETDLIKITSSNKLYTMESLKKKLSKNGFTSREGSFEVPETRNYKQDEIVGLLLQYGVIAWNKNS